VSETLDILDREESFARNPGLRLWDLTRNHQVDDLVRFAAQDSGNLAQWVEFSHVVPPCYIFRRLSFSREIFCISILLYYMIEFQDDRGRLVVVFRAGYRQYCVFVDGEWEAEFRTGKEAVEHAKSIIVVQIESNRVDWTEK
jgi:hypothetical protein